MLWEAGVKTDRHAELVSASISSHSTGYDFAPWTLKQVHDDSGGEADIGFHPDSPHSSLRGGYADEAIQGTKKLDPGLNPG